MYRLGVIGIGHWFKRLHTGVQRVGGIEVAKGLGTRPYEKKAALMKELGITKEMYYTTDPKTGSIPEQFFEGIDVVQIADPNRFHLRQTVDSLERGKKAVVEKSFAVNKEEFDEFVGYINANGKKNDVYLHLHYMHKMPTQELVAQRDGMLVRFGKVKEVNATFFEPANDDDKNRTWLFSPENGGLFMDWIHPMEVVFHAFDCMFGNMDDVKTYAVNPAYDRKNPTGVHTSVGLYGKDFIEGAKLNMWIAKGVDQKSSRKSMRFVFESGNYLMLDYVGSEHEFTSARRGGVELGRMDGQAYVPETTKMLVGETSSDIYIREIVNLCEGRNPGFTIGQITELFKPQWDYQSKASDLVPRSNKDEVKKFISAGLDA